MKRWVTMTNDPVFWVATSLFLVLLPHFSRLPGWMELMILLLLFWRLAAILKPRLMPHKLILLMVAIGTGAGVFLHFGTLFGKIAGTAFLSVLLGIKLLESQSKRDYMLLIALSFFIIVTNFFFSQSIPTVISMLLIVVLLVISMITINKDEAQLSISQRSKMALKLVLQAMPLMLVLFVLFPRIPGPLWKLPDNDQSGVTGLSDTMSPGNIASLIESNAIAFRVQFEGTPPAQDKLYWRGQVFWYFDGRTWEPGKRNITASPTLHGMADPVDYTVTLEPHARRWLFALDMPVNQPVDVIYTRNFLLRSEHDINSLYQYKVQSYLDYRIQTELSDWERSAGLKIPASSNARTVAMGQQWRERFSNPRQIVDHALNMFNEREYRYTLRPPLTPGFDPVDQFVFDTRAGFCEHYASAFTLLMRAAGIPARVIIGYQGGEINPVNGALTVQQSNAHAWSEVWLAGQGWVRIDPTAAIAPQRVEQNLNAALVAGEFRPLHMRIDTGMIRNLRQYWDAIDNRWNQWVVGYDQAAQKALLSSLLNEDINLEDVARMMIIVFAAVFMVIAGFIFWPRSVGSEDTYQKHYRRFCNKLSRAGLTREAHEGPRDFSLRAMQRFPDQKDIITLVTSIYINARYRSRPNNQQIDRMKKLVTRLKPRQKK